MLELATHSRLKAFRRCRRLHKLQYEIGARALVEATPLLAGTALHAWIEAWLLAGQTWINPGMEATQETDLRSPAWALAVAFDKVAARDPFEAARLRAMCLAYHLRWQATPWRVLHVEVRFRAPLVNPITGRTSKTAQRGGKIDAIIEIASAETEWDGQWVVEHKSAASDISVTSTYVSRLRSDAQCSDYMIGAKALGVDARGVLYDVVGKPQLRPLDAVPEEARRYTKGMGCKKCFGASGEKGTGCTACASTGWKDEPRLRAGTRIVDETVGEYGMRCFMAMLEEPDRYLQRHRVARLDSELREHEIDTWLNVKSMNEERRLDVAPRNPDACHDYNHACDFYDVCWSGKDISDPALFKIGKHPELRVVSE